MQVSSIAGPLSVSIAPGKILEISLVDLSMAISRSREHFSSLLSGLIGNPKQGCKLWTPFLILILYSDCKIFAALTRTTHGKRFWWNSHIRLQDTSTRREDFWIFHQSLQEYHKCLLQTFRIFDIEIETRVLFSNIIHLLGSGLRGSGDHNFRPSFSTMAQRTKRPFLR